MLNYTKWNKILSVLQISVLMFCALGYSVSVFSNELDVRNIFKSDHLYVESAVSMLVLVTSSEGKEIEANCIHNYYFGSPQSNRLVVNKAWKFTDNNAASVLTLLFRNLCNSVQDFPSEMNVMWDIADADTENIFVSNPTQELTGLTLDAYIRMLVAHAARHKKKSQAKCLGTAYGDDSLYKEIISSMKAEPNLSALFATYNASHKLCGYPENGPLTADFRLPIIYSMKSAARERILSVRDLERCEIESSDTTSRANCVEKVFDKRSKNIIETAFSQNANNLEKVEQKLTRMRSLAWRLPDGRLIFEDVRGSKWHFENGDIVPNDLAAKRVRPKNNP